MKKTKKRRKKERTRVGSQKEEREKRRERKLRDSECHLGAQGKAKACRVGGREESAVEVAERPRKRMATRKGKRRHREGISTGHLKLAVWHGEGSHTGSRRYERSGQVLGVERPSLIWKS